MSRVGGSRNALAGVSFVLVGALFIQWSAAVVAPAFVRIGPSAASAWRFLLGAIVLAVVTRPPLGSWTRHQWVGAIALGASAAFMNQAFYQAIARIPLGSAAAIEYLGPFVVAAFGKRSWRHLVFVVVAAIGVLALTRPGGGITLVGALFAAGSGLGWAAYAFSSHRVGGSTTGFGGLAVSMMFSALFTLPMALGSAPVVLGHPLLLGRLLIVSTMAIVIGFGAELQSLRRLKPTIVSVLLSLDPAVAFGVGFFLLNQHVTRWDLFGLGCVVVAGAGVTFDVAGSDLGAPR
ncbi:MAG TPA: EamA family transporter [Acidimicrobiales bacterium]|nr:EamA family transporter [Acidimicrobiales bacterium]